MKRGEANVLEQALDFYVTRLLGRITELTYKVDNEKN
jgi:hypothetical protein